MARRRTGRGGYTLMELLVTLTLAATLLSLGIGSFQKLGRRTAYQRALGDASGLVNKVRNSSSSFPSALVLDPEMKREDGTVSQAMYGRTEQILQELHFEPRTTSDGEVTFAASVNGLDVDTSAGELLPHGGHLGGGLQLRGSPVDCRAYAPYDVTDGMYVTVWVRLDAARACVLVSKGDAFNVRLAPRRDGSAAIEARIGVDEGGLREERRVTANVPRFPVGKWVGVTVGYDRRHLTVSTDDGYGPVERASVEETRPLRRAPEAPLLVGQDLMGVIDDFRFGGVTVQDPVYLPGDVAIDGPGRTIHFRDGKLDGRFHPGVEQIRLRSQGNLAVLEIGPGGTVQSLRETSVEDAAPPPGSEPQKAAPSYEKE